LSSNFFVFSQIDFQKFIEFSQKAVQNSRILMKIPRIFSKFYGKDQHLRSFSNFMRFRNEHYQTFQKMSFETLESKLEKLEKLELEENAF